MYLTNIIDRVINFNFVYNRGMKRGAEQTRGQFSRTSDLLKNRQISREAK